MLMRNALILHGTNNNSQGNWFPWLKKELKKRDWQVWVPDLPRADRPNIKRYNRFIFSNKNWPFNQDSVIIGHSSGAVAILGLLQSFPQNKLVDTCILVGSFKDDLGREDLKDLYKTPLNYQKIKNHAKSFIFIHSDDDPHCPLSHAKYQAKKLNAKLILKKGQGHFNLETSLKYKKFPFLLELLEGK